MCSYLSKGLTVAFHWDFFSFARVVWSSLCSDFQQLYSSTSEEQDLEEEAVAVLLETREGYVSVGEKAPDSYCAL